MSEETLCNFLSARYTCTGRRTIKRSDTSMAGGPSSHQQSHGRSFPPNWELYRSVQFSIKEQLLSRDVKRFRGGLVFKADRLLYHSTLGLRVIKKKKKRSTSMAGGPSSHQQSHGRSFPRKIRYRVTSLIRKRADLGPYSRAMSRALWW